MDFFEIKSGGKKILASGSVVSFYEEPIEFDFGTKKDPLKIIFSFKEDKENSEKRTFVNIDKNNALVFELINFDNPIGTGSSSPINIGTLSDKELFLHYRVYAFDNRGDKLLNYTLYIDEDSKVKNEKK